MRDTAARECAAGELRIGRRQGCLVSYRAVVVARNIGFDHPRRVARYEAMRWHRPGDDGAGADDGIGADLDILNDDGARTHHRAPAETGLAADDSTGADRNEVGNIGVVADAGAAVDEDEPADLSGRADIHRAIDVAAVQQSRRRRYDGRWIDQDRR